MATGEHNGQGTVARTEDDAAYGPGATMMPAGRLSIARTIKPLPPTVPFTPMQLARLDETITLASRATGLDFSIYLGDLGQDTRARAEALHASIGLPAASDAVVIAVSPGQRVVEIVTGEEAYRRLPDRACKLAVMAMVASFKEGDLIGGLISALRMLTEQAGSPPKHVGPVAPH